MAKTKRFRSRRSRVTLAVVSIVVLALVAFFIYRGVAGDAEAAVSYTTGTVQKMTLTSSIDGTGNIELPDTASVTPAVSGEVSGLEVQIGDKVEKGQVLFTLLNAQLDVAVAEAQNAYDKAMLAVDSATLALTSAKTSLASVYSSRHTALQVKQSKASVTSAELAITAAKNAVTSAEIALQQAEEDAAARTVTAPISGVITAVSVENGDTVGGSGGSAAMTITNPDLYQATISLAESDIGDVEVGQTAILTFDALPDVTSSGRVTRVDTTGTNESGVVSYGVVITPDVMDESVRGGMTVSVSIITDMAQDVLAVPSSAVKSAAGRKYVQILQNGQPVDVTVEVGMSNDSYTEITSGLTEGQEVITATITASGGTTSTTTRGQPNVLEGGGFIMDGNGPPPGAFPSGGVTPPLGQ
jgi:macrolide-specific efflux system membrane fusion protein